eukprot:UN33501
MQCAKRKGIQKVVFGLAFFHAVIQERRKFGGIGWNIPYSWMNSDLQTSKMQLRMYLDEQDGLPLDTLNYIIGEVNYGGRITDDKDQRCCRSILAKYMSRETVEDDTYCFDPEGTYHPPRETELDKVRAYISQLPMEDKPETFGLHGNAEITFQQQEARNFQTTIRKMQSSAGGNSGNADGEKVTDLCSTYSSRVPT